MLVSLFNILTKKELDDAGWTLGWSVESKETMKYSMKTQDEHILFFSKKKKKKKKKKKSIVFTILNWYGEKDHVVFILYLYDSILRVGSMKLGVQKQRGSRTSREKREADPLLLFSSVFFRLLWILRCCCACRRKLHFFLYYPPKCMLKFSKFHNMLSRQLLTVYIM
jgi:hypothetical protein